MLKQSKNINVNYAARIARVDQIIPIPDAHSIVKAVLGTDTVVVSKDMKVGDIVVFFPVGCCISEKYLGANNLYERSSAARNSNYDDFCKLQAEYNLLQVRENKTEKDISKLQELEAQIKKSVGFFNNQGRVRCIKLRGEMSMGYVAPVETLEKVWPELKEVLWSKYLGETVDMIGEDRLCWKWIPVEQKHEQQVSYKMPWYKRGMRKLKKFDRLIPGFFKQHYDTAMLERNAHFIDPQDTITVTTKVHGTSIILANLPVRKKLNWFQKLLKFFGIKVVEQEFGDIYSTRRVIQNKYINPFAKRANQTPNNEYARCNEDFIGFLAPGMTVYGEVVGYTPGGRCIQTPNGVDHDYGCERGEYKFMPYRITETDMDGNVREWSIVEVMEWVDKVRGMLFEDEQKILMDLQLLYHGKAGEMYDNLFEKINITTGVQEYLDERKAFVESAAYVGYLPKYLESFEEFVKNRWRVAWIEAMKNDKEHLGMELPEPLCKNKKAPREGVVVRIDGDELSRAWKLKTKKHYELSQKAADAGEADPEDVA